MASITWPTGIPSGTSNVGLAASDLRKVKKTLQTGMEQSCNFGDQVNPVLPGASSLQTKAGVPFFDASDTTIVWEYQYKPVMDSTTSRLHSWASVAAAGGFNSQGTFITNGPGFVDFRHQWVNGSEVSVEESVTWVDLHGSVYYGATTAQTVSFGNNSATGFYFEEPPMVFVCQSMISSIADLAHKPLHVTEITKTGFTFRGASGQMTASNNTCEWWAFGYTKGVV